jgi:hypothetical protein
MNDNDKILIAGLEYVIFLLENTVNIINGNTIVDNESRDRTRNDAEKFIEICKREKYI